MNLSMGGWNLSENPQGQILFTLLAVCVVVGLFLWAMGKKDHKTYLMEGMTFGFILGSTLGGAFITPLVGAPIGMLLGIYLGRRKKKPE